MLIKLLKYEFKFTGRSLLPIYAALLVLTVLMNLGDGMRFGFNNAGMFEGFFKTMLIFTYSCVISAVCIITVVLLVQRFYKNLLRDEGYLMHTLPVSAAQNIASKLICAVVWSVVSLLVAGLSLLFISMTFSNWQQFFDGLADGRCLPWKRWLWFCLLWPAALWRFIWHWPLVTSPTIIKLLVRLGLLLV